MMTLDQLEQILNDHDPVNYQYEIEYWENYTDQCDWIYPEDAGICLNEIRKMLDEDFVQLTVNRFLPLNEDTLTTVWTYKKRDKEMLNRAVDNLVNL